MGQKFRSEILTLSTLFCKDSQISQCVFSVYTPPDSLNRDFEEGAVGLLSFPFPKITCSKAYAGREKIVAAFERYYHENGPLSASHLVKALGQASNVYYLSVNNQARSTGMPFLRIRPPQLFGRCFTCCPTQSFWKRSVSRSCRC